MGVHTIPQRQVRYTFTVFLSKEISNGLIIGSSVTESLTMYKMRFALVKKNTKELQSDSSFDHFYFLGKGKGSSVTHTKGFFAHVTILLLTKGFKIIAFWCDICRQLQKTTYVINLDQVL